VCKNRFFAYKIRIKMRIMLICVMIVWQAQSAAQSASLLNDYMVFRESMRVCRLQCPEPLIAPLNGFLNAQDAFCVWGEAVDSCVSRMTVFLERDKNCKWSSEDTRRVDGYLHDFLKKLPKSRRIAQKVLTLVQERYVFNREKGNIPDERDVDFDSAQMPYKSAQDALGDFWKYMKTYCTAVEDQRAAIAALKELLADQVAIIEKLNEYLDDEIYRGEPICLLGLELGANLQIE